MSHIYKKNSVHTITYTKSEMCDSVIRQSRICLEFVCVQTIALTIMKLCMRLHKYPLQSEFYEFLPPLEKYAFFGKKCNFHFFRSISKTIQLFQLFSTPIDSTANFQHIMMFFSLKISPMLKLRDVFKLFLKV